MVTPAKTRPGTRGKHVDTAEDTESPWVTLVWDDPVNLMTYVTYVFQKLFGYSEPHATKLMLQVHNEGKAVVSAGSRESMEVDVSKLHAAPVGDHAAGPLNHRGGTQQCKWKRVDTATAHACSALASHERRCSRAGDVHGRDARGRESSSPADELEEITGLKTGTCDPRMTRR